MTKAQFIAIVERAYREGIGARRLSRMIGYSPFHIRRTARDLGMPRLPRYTLDTHPSDTLLNLIAVVTKDVAGA